LADDKLYQIGGRYRPRRRLPAKNQVIDVADWKIVILWAQNGNGIKEWLASA